MGRNRRPQGKGRLGGKVMVRKLGDLKKRFEGTKPYVSSGRIEFPSGQVYGSGEPGSDEICRKIEAVRPRLSAWILQDGQSQAQKLLSMRLILNDKDKVVAVEKQEKEFPRAIHFYDADARSEGVYLHCSPDEHPEPRAKAGEDIREQPWLPLASDAVPPADQDHRVGWPRQEPQVTWSYLRDGDGISIEVVWSLAGLPADWHARIVAARREGVTCESEILGKIVLSPAPQTELLEFRGRGPRLAAESSLPFLQELCIREPVALRAPGSSSQDADGGEPRVSRTIAATVPVLRMTALLPERETRFISTRDLEEPFQILAETEARFALPQSIPNGFSPGWPWGLSIEELAGREGDTVRRWKVTAAPEDTDRKGRWSEVPWQDQRLVWPFGDGRPDQEAALWRVDARRARLGWAMPEARDDGALCFAQPVWRSIDLSIPSDIVTQGSQFVYRSEVRVKIDGLEEGFSVDAESELPERRLVLAPDRWRVFDPAGERIAQPEILGPAGGAVWWRLEPLAESPGRPARPADWALGEAPLLVTDGTARPHGWGGLAVATALPRDAVEIPAVSSGEQHALSVVAGDDTALWIDHCGFVDCYDRSDMHFPDSKSMVAWTARRGLPLFPQPPSALLRSMCPLYAVVDEDAPTAVRLEVKDGLSRPVLFLGADLIDPTTAASILVGDRSRLRVGLAAGSSPPVWGGQAFAGKNWPLPSHGAESTLWLAVQPRDELEGPPRYLLRWDAAGWWFAGVYLPPGGMVRLGIVEAPGGRGHVPIVLEDPAVSAAQRFVLRIHLDPTELCFEWGPGAPEGVRNLPKPQMQAWYQEGALAPDTAPELLQRYRIELMEAGDPITVAFLPAGATVKSQESLAVRVWRGRPASRPEATPPPPTGEKREALSREVVDALSRTGLADALEP